MKLFSFPFFYKLNFRFTDFAANRSPGPQRFSAVLHVDHSNSLPFYPPHIDTELSLYKLCLTKNHNTLCLDVKDLPSSCVDVVLLALDDHEMLKQERSQPWHRAGIAWARNPGSGVSPPVTIAIDPLTPTLGYKPELTIKVCRRIYPIMNFLALYIMLVRISFHSPPLILPLYLKF